MGMWDRGVSSLAAKPFLPTLTVAHTESSTKWGKIQKIAPLATSNIFTQLIITLLHIMYLHNQQFELLNLSLYNTIRQDSILP